MDTQISSVANNTPALSLIVPCFNEEKRLEQSIRLVRESLNSFAIDYEVVIVDDGSRDRTSEIAQRAGHPFQLLRLDQNGGKGRAIRAGVLDARGAVIAFTDADIPIGLATLRYAYEMIQRDRCDMAVADRTLVLSGAHIHVPAIRRCASVGFRWCRQMILPTRVCDTQCGLKAFRADVARFLFEPMKTHNFSFDVEIIARAERAGCRIVSLPAELVRLEHSTVRLRRHVIPMLASLWACRRDQKNWPQSFERPALRKDRAA